MNLFDDKEEEGQFRALAASWIVAAHRAAGDGRSSKSVVDHALEDVEAVVRAIKTTSAPPRVQLECRSCGAVLQAVFGAIKGREDFRLLVDAHSCRENDE